MPKGPMTRVRKRTPDSPPAELEPIVSASSSHVTPQPPTAAQTDAVGAYDSDEGGPEEFMGYADEKLEERIKRLTRTQTLYLPDGGEKIRKFVYRMKKELDRRRAARPTKDEVLMEDFNNFTDQDQPVKIKCSNVLYGCTPDGGKKLGESVCQVEKELDQRLTAGPRKVDTGHEQAMQIVDGDDPCAFMPPLVENTSNHAPGKKLRGSVCQVEKELDHQLAAGPGKVDTGHGQAAKIVGGNDPSTLMPPPVENASNRAPIINSGATDGGLYPVAFTNLEGLSVPSTNVGAEEVQPTAYTCPGQKGEDTGKKRQLSQMAMLLEVENYLELKMKQIRRLVEEVKEAPKQEDRFTIEKCVAALEAIEELTDVEKAKALKLFKCRLNREIFMNTKTASVRLIWLKREIDA